MSIHSLPRRENHDRTMEKLIAVYLAVFFVEVALYAAFVLGWIP